jgi:8-oxo-dGTP diphosphatase
MPKIYYKYALCIIRNNRLLVQEEDEEQNFLLPGGRAEDGETAEQALYRELQEELGIELDMASLVPLGEYIDEAGSIPDALVQVNLYQGRFSGELKPCGEVKRLVWLSKDDDLSQTNPVTRNKIIPSLIKKGILY